MRQFRPDGVLDGVAERWGDGDHRMLAHASRAVRPVELGRLDDDALDLVGKVPARGDLVVGERGVQEMALLVVDVAFAERRPEALDHAADALPADQFRIDRLAYVVGGGDLQDVVLAGRRVHLDDDPVGAVGPVEGRQALAGLLVEIGEALRDIAPDADERPADGVAVGVGIADRELREA